jgi:hypothetical protein
VGDRQADDHGEPRRHRLDPPGEGVCSGSLWVAVGDDGHGDLLGERVRRAQHRGSSFTGVAASSPVDGTPPGVASYTTAAWATNSVTVSGGSLVSGATTEVQTNLTSTPATTTPATIEEYDINGGAGSFAATGAYRIDGGLGGTYTVAGTWSGTAIGIALIVAYKVGIVVDNTTKPALAGMFSPQLRQDGWF